MSQACRRLSDRASAPAPASGRSSFCTETGRAPAAACLRPSPLAPGSVAGRGHEVACQRRRSALRWRSTAADSALRLSRRPSYRRRHGVRSAPLLASLVAWAAGAQVASVPCAARAAASAAGVWPASRRGGSSHTPDARSPLCRSCGSWLQPSSPLLVRCAQCCSLLHCAARVSRCRRCAAGAVQPRA